MRGLKGTSLVLRMWMVIVKVTHSLTHSLVRIRHPMRAYRISNWARRVDTER